jgi:hypothetical protein
MSKKRFDELRMCRLDGAKPTARERWIAFSRLYRLTQGHGASQDMAAVECLHVLMPSGRWLRLVQAAEGSPSRTHAPKFLRRILLNSDRKRRLHGQCFEWLEADRHVARQLAERGTEMTPDEVGATRGGIFRMARAKAAQLGIALPADDEGLLAYLAAGRRDHDAD